MATITSILNRISEMGSRIGKNSIGKGDFFRLLTDIVKRQQSTELNMSNLSLRKIYASIAAMEADVAAPLGDDGEKILKGQLVVISAVGVDMGKVFRYSGTVWEYAGQIGDLSQKANRQELSNWIKHKKGKNLLNPQAVDNGWISASGIEIQENYYHSDFIDILEGETLYANFQAGGVPLIALYDINKSFIGSVASITKQITGTAVSKFARFSIEAADTSVFENLMVCNEANATFEKYNPLFGYEDLLKRRFLDRNELLSPSSLAVGVNSINKFNKDNVTAGFYLDPDGIPQPNADYSISDYIPIFEGETLKCNRNAGGTPRICVYDANKKLLACIPSLTQQVVWQPGYVYVRFTVENNWVDTIMIVSGEFPSSYKPFNPVSGYSNKPFDNVLIYSDFALQEDLVLVESTFEPGIFEDLTQNAYKTSGFIALSIKDGFAHYIVFGNTMNYGFSLMRIYDKNHNLLADLKGSSEAFPKEANIPYRINFPDNAFYVRYSTLVNTNTGLFVAQAKSLKDCITRVVNSMLSPGGESLTVLWSGTSITEGSSYAQNACARLFLNSINKGIGASYIRFDPTTPTPQEIGYASGLSLSATVAETEAKFRPRVTDGTITEAQLNIWKAASYENRLLPFIPQADVWVMDHGFNDRYDLPAVVAAGKDAIDWNSQDRTTFIGAFNYLLHKVWEIKPFIKIVVQSYFQNTFNEWAYNGSSICTVQKWIAEHYEFPFMDVYNYSGMNNTYVPNSANYISDFNTAYGTAHTKFLPDASGNIMFFQLFCPDAVHPHSDLTGNSNKRLDAIVTKLLRDSI